MKKEIIIDIYNNPLHAEIFQAVHRLIIEQFVKPIEIERDRYKTTLQTIAHDCETEERYAAQMARMALNIIKPGDPETITPKKD